MKKTNKKNLLNLLPKPSECSCEWCQFSCHCPCEGTVEDMENLMEKGYGNRLSLLYSIDAPEVLRPSLKGEEGKKTYYSFSSRGCTFFNEGKCELHNLGLKPWEGHVSHHDNTQEEKDAIGKFLEKEWKSKKAKDLIKRWKNEFLKKENK